MTIELKPGWNNGTFKLDSFGSNLIFGFYPLDNGTDFILQPQGIKLYNPAGEENNCFMNRLNDVFLYTAICNSTTFEVKPLF